MVTEKLVQELLGYVKLEFWGENAALSLQMPTDLELAAAVAECGASLAPLASLDEIRAELQKAVSGAVVARRTEWVNQRGIQGQSAGIGAQETGIGMGGPKIEAAILGLKGEALESACRQNGIVVQEHMTNRGITAMRRKNALLAKMRRGESVTL